MMVSYPPAYGNKKTLYQLIIFCWTLFKTVQDIQCWDLIYSTEFTSQDDWMIFEDSIELSSGLMSGCWDKNIFGGMSNIVIAKNFFLPPHYLVGIQFTIYDFSLSYLYIVVLFDDQEFNSYSQVAPFYQCHNNDEVNIYSSFDGGYHFSPTLQIQIFRPNFIDSHFWGITDFELYIGQCPPQCNSCDEFENCDDWTYLNSIYGEQNLLFMEGWFKNQEYFNEKKNCGRVQFYGPFTQFDVIQHHSIIPQDHSKIKLRFKLIVVKVPFDNFFKVQLNQEERNISIGNWYNFLDVNLICGQQQKISVVDVYFQHTSPDLLISIQIQPIVYDFDTYFGILDFEIFTDAQKGEEICNDKNIYAFDGCFNLQFDCSEGCSNCVKGKCLECDSNWMYDPVNSNCISIMVGFEEYDNFNSLPYDGCYQCQFSCSLNCIKCQYGSCLICNPSFLLINNNCIQNYPNNRDFSMINQKKLNELTEFLPINHCLLECLECYYSLCIKCLPDWNVINFECIQECEFEVVADFKEYCYDINYNKVDECYNCKFQTPFYTTSSLSVCGDGIVQDLEECDDGNTIPHDGCFECQYDCQENCIECLDGVCLQTYFEELQITTCNFGFYLIDNKCLSICGDLIVASDEKCDDENNEPFDGCFKCQYSCSLNCQNCIDGQCMNCENGFNLENNICKEQCGNGITTFNEECDDGNIFSEDGCSEICQIEIFWKCIIDQKQRSLCFQIDNPIVQIKFLNTTFNKQFILMSSSQKVRLNERHQNLTQNLQTQIININPLNYIITFDVEAEPTFEKLNDIQYLFTIELLQQLEVELIFHIYFNITLVNNYDLEILNKELQIKLTNPIVLNQVQKEASQKTTKFNTMILIILGISGCIILLSGSPQDFFEVLDALQYQSYLRFINVAFPENMFIYFESSELVSIQTFLVKFNLVDLFQEIFGSEFLESFGKFYFYSINADLVINLQSQMCQIALLLLFFIFSNLYTKFYNKKCFSSRQLIEIQKENSIILTRMLIILYYINKIIMGFGKIFTIKGLRMLFLANSWDALFKIILYLYSKPQNSIRTYLSCTLGVIIMISLISISISCMISSKQSRKLCIKKIFRHQGLIVLKKMQFLLVLIKAQDTSIIQCLLLALINSFYLAIILIAKLIKDNIDVIVIFWFELPIIIFALSSLAHHNDFVKHITNDQQVLLGFCQIGMLCFGLISPLIKYGYILIKKGIDYVNKRQKQIIAQKQQQIKFEQMFF